MAQMGNGMGVSALSTMPMIAGQDKGTNNECWYEQVGQVAAFDFMLGPAGAIVAGLAANGLAANGGSIT